MLDLAPYQEGISRICRQYGVRKLDLFGSATTDEFGPESDVDVVADFDSETGFFDRYFSLKESLEHLFNRPVDVVMEGAPRNPWFIATMQASRRAVYAA